MRSISLAVAAMLAGCAAAQPSQQEIKHFSDYRQKAYYASQGYAWAGVPEDVQNQFRVCLVDSLLSTFTKKELLTMDNYARGYNTKTDAEIAEMTERARERAGWSPANATKVLSEFCPDTVKAMEAYGHAPGSMSGTSGNTKHIYPTAQAFLRNAFEAETPDDYPWADRRKLIDCLTLSIVHDMPPDAQASIVGAANSGRYEQSTKTTLMSALLMGQDEATREQQIKQSLNRMCPDLHSKYPEFP